jgi:hypothetical protein
MPEGLAHVIQGRFTDDQRNGAFKPQVDASPQDKLLA